MKKYIQKSLILSAIIFFIVTFISFLCFDYIEEMKLSFLIGIIAFLSMGIHYLTAHIFYDSFLKEIICKYILVEIMVLVIGVLCGWFVMSNWWMSFVYATPAVVLAYLVGIVKIKRDVQAINQKLVEKKERISDDK